MMIVWNQNRRIKEHRIYQGSVSHQKPAGPGRGQPDLHGFSDGADRSRRQPEMLLARKVKLEWKRDQLALDVVTAARRREGQPVDSSRAASSSSSRLEAMSA